MTTFPVMAPVRIGEVEIAAIMEYQKSGPEASEFFVGYDQAQMERHLPQIPREQFDHATGRLIMAFQSFVVKTPRHVMLIDTCCGEDKFLPEPMPHPTGAWLDGLNALGLSVADVDFVLCTHLHIDHTGWNTRLEKGRWVPTFPNARYVFSRAEYAYWETLAKSGVPQPRVSAGIWEMNCLPVAEAGQALLVDDGHVLDEFVSLVPSPGHSPHHVCVRIASGGQEAIAIGDLLHSVVQCHLPDWSTRICWDARLAARSRRAILSEAAERRSLVLPVHFPCPSAGRVTARGEGFDYDFHG